MNIIINVNFNFFSFSFFNKKYDILVTFKVVAISGTPSVVVNNKKYVMKLEQYPIYTATINVNAPVKYHYALNDREESFSRKATSDITLNDFFDRKYTVKEHPLLPKAFETFDGYKKSKLFDGI